MMGIHQQVLSNGDLLMVRVQEVSLRRGLIEVFYKATWSSLRFPVRLLWTFFGTNLLLASPGAGVSRSAVQLAFWAFYHFLPPNSKKVPKSLCVFQGASLLSSAYSSLFVLSQIYFFSCGKLQDYKFQQKVSNKIFRVSFSFPKNLNRDFPKA